MTSLLSSLLSTAYWLMGYQEPLDPIALKTALSMLPNRLSISKMNIFFDVTYHYISYVSLKFIWSLLGANKLREQLCRQRRETEALLRTNDLARARLMVSTYIYPSIQLNYNYCICCV